MKREDYNRYEEALIKKTVGVRADYLSHKNKTGADGRDALNSMLFNIKDEEQESFEFVHKTVNYYMSRTIECIIMDLCKERSISSTLYLEDAGIPIVETFREYSAAPLFAILIGDKDPILYLFKNYGMHNTIRPEVLLKMMEYIGIEKYTYISMTEDKAYTEVLNHNDDLNDESRGTNIYSFKYLFVSHFGEEEYEEFKRFEERVVKRVKDILGYTIVKQLTPNGLFSFKRTFEKEIVKYPYYDKIDNSSLDSGIVDKVLKQYIDDGYYTALLNEGSFSDLFDIEDVSFSESFITAEWLYQSMPNVGKIDLTTISIGYIKAIEQLVFVYMSTWYGKDKFIDTYDRKGRTNTPDTKDEWQSVITKFTVKNKKKFIMLQRLINFMEDNDDIYNVVNVKPYLIERLKEVKELRNGYFHKDNLSEREIVDKARESAFVIFMLLLGSVKAEEEGKSILGIQSNHNEFEKLCDFTNCNNLMAYYYEVAGTTKFAIGHRDEDIMISDDGKASYSGVYFNEFKSLSEDTRFLRITEIGSLEKNIVKFNEDIIPKRIYKKEMTPCKTGFEITGSKELIWDDGKFLGEIIG